MGAYGCGVSGTGKLYRVLKILQKFNWHCVQCVQLRDYLNELLCMPFLCQMMKYIIVTKSNKKLSGGKKMKVEDMNLLLAMLFLCRVFTEHSPHLHSCLKLEMI